MKQGNVITKLIILVLFLGIAAYFGVYVWNSVTGSVVTTALYTQTCEEQITVTGWFFRDETVIDEDSRLVQLGAAEGERVAKGDTVARIYTSSEGYALQQTLEEAQAELESLLYIQSRMGEGVDTTELDDTILSAFTALRYAAASGALSSLSGDADELRSLVFHREYSEEDADSLAEQIAEARALVTRLQEQSTKSYTTVTAASPGWFSAVVDGYESVMTLDALDTLTPTGLAALVGRKADTTSTVGKIITSSGWYFACNVPTEEGAALQEGTTVTLRFESSSRDFTATVLRAGEAEDGVFTVVFWSNEYASLLTALREETVTIVLDSVTGFYVPKRAIRVSEDGEIGIYRVSGLQPEWFEEELLWEEDDYYQVTQLTGENQTTLEKASRLRDGDAIIIRGESMYEGKVVSG